MTLPLLFHGADEVEALVAAPRAWAAERGLVLECAEDGMSWAVFSPDHVYRYLLCRRWDLGAPLVSWTMLNPSVAGAMRDDPSVRKVKGFSRRRGAGGFVLTNLAALCSTNPRWLGVEDPIGEHNEDAIRFALSLVAARSEKVAAWGLPPSKKVWRKLEPMAAQAVELGVSHCYGLTEDGHPRHPLMLPYSTPLQPYLPALMARAAVVVR